MNKGYLKMRRSFLNSGLVQRPNKLARGMTETIYRSRAQRSARAELKRPVLSIDRRTEQHYNDVSRLSVTGTLDRLAFAVVNPRTKRKSCPCCDSKNVGNYILSDAGRRRLARLKAFPQR